MIALLIALAFVAPPKLPPLPGQRSTPAENAEFGPAPAQPGNVPAPPKTEPQKPSGTPSGAAKPGDAAVQKPSGDAPVQKPSTVVGEPDPLDTMKSPKDEPDVDGEPLPLASPEELDALAEPDPSTSAKPGPDQGAERIAAKSTKFEHSATIVRTAELEPERDRLTFRRRPKAPERTSTFSIGYRQFAIADGLGRHQNWHLVGLEISPLRRYARLGLITEFGAEGGPAARDGDRADIMIVQKAALGAQYPGWVTPYLEFQGGAGAARLELFERSDLVFLYTLGIDAGAQWAVTRWMFLNAAIGWVRPVLRRPNGSAHYDALAFKIGFGF